MLRDLPHAAPLAYRSVAVAVACSVLISCTPIPRDIAVTTDPPGATCELLQATKIIATVKATPGTVHVQSTYPDITFACRHQGFRYTEYTREWTPGNILIGGPPGRTIDAALGFDYGAPVDIPMQPVASP